MSGWPEPAPPPASRLWLVAGHLLLAPPAMSACQAGIGIGQPAATEDAVQATNWPEGFALSSPDFNPGGSIPRRYTCDGDDASPPLAWAGAPGEAAAFALVMD